MKEIVYRCNRCHKLINGTVHRIGVTDEKGEQTRYGALFDNTDLCDSCIEEVTLAVITEIDRNENARGSSQQKQDGMQNRWSTRVRQGSGAASGSRTLNQQGSRISRKKRRKY